MGSEASKEIQEIADILENDKICVTPVNKYSCRNISIDPRSPTEGIVRTPIEVRREDFNANGESHLSRRWKSEPDVSPNTKEKYFKHTFHLLNNDPRSPTFGIVRTPIQVLCNHKKTCEESLKKYGSRDNIPRSAAITTEENTVEDCRSPSLGISRTPIQVPIISPERNSEISECPPHEVKNQKILDLTPSKFTPLSTKFTGSESFVYTDDGKIEVKIKKSADIFESNSSQEKENDINLKRKLVFTPEAKTGIKVRTPLGSRCNYQDSPSQYLKIMQVQKIGQDVAMCASENIPNSINLSVKNAPRKNTVVDWDKDSTLIM